MSKVKTQHLEVSSELDQCRAGGEPDMIDGERVVRFRAPLLRSAFVRGAATKRQRAQELRDRAHAMVRGRAEEGDVATCNWCGEELRWMGGRGWVHAEGGIVMMHCPACSWRGAPEQSPQTCPKCGHPGIRDDHVALAVHRRGSR